MPDTSQLAYPQFSTLDNLLLGTTTLGALLENGQNNGGFGATGGGGTGAARSGFNDPGLTQPQGDIYSMLQRLIGSGPDLQGFINQGMNSPLLQSILQPALATQARQFGQQRQDVTDAMRAAGGLRSSQYGVNLNRLQGDQSISQGNLMSQIIAQTLGPLLQSQMAAYKAPIDAYNTLFNNMPNKTFWPGFAPQPTSGSRSSGSPSMSPSPSTGLAPLSGRSGVGGGYGAPSNPNDYGLGYSGGNFGNEYGALGDAGGGIAYNPASGSYESVNPNFNQPTYSNGFDNQQYTDYGQYLGSYGLGYDPSGDQQQGDLQYNYPDQSGWSMMENY